MILLSTRPQILLASLAFITLAVGRSTASEEPSDAPAPTELRLHQLQVLGTHNSYHVAPHPNVAPILALAGKDLLESIEYTHRPLTEQLEKLGMRHFELDLYADPEGGRYSVPAARAIVEKSGKDAGPPHDPEGLLKRPGFKVIHAADFDFRSTVLTLRAALEEIDKWSRAHRRHVPVLILLELKETRTGPIGRQPIRFDAKLLRAIDEEILSVLDRSRIITPASVQGDAPNLRDRIRKGGWPTIDASRGKMMFALDNGGNLRDRYIAATTDAKRLLFVSVDPEHPLAGWIKLNDPVRDFERIRKLVAEGFLVRTRADADTRQARQNDTERRDRALASGAQFVSTDYPEPDEKLSSYRVSLPGGVRARANPVSAKGWKGGREIE